MIFSQLKVAGGLDSETLFVWNFLRRGIKFPVIQSAGRGFQMRGAL